MAAYAALLSLNFTVDQHHHRSIAYPAKNMIQSAIETIPSLLKMFEHYDYQTSSEEIVELEKDMADAAYDVDYVLECLALDPVLAKSGYKLGKHSSNLFSEDEMLQIMNKFMFLREKAMDMMEVKVTSEELPRSLTTSAFALDRMLGFDDHLDGLRTRFKDIDTEDLQILPIVGMGGIGKTTLVRNVYESKGAKNNFDVRIWCTISQSPDLRSVLLSFLQDLEIVDDGQTNPEEQLRKCLEEKRYLVVLDDICGVDVWDTIKSFFPDNGKGSLIIITSRLLSVASYIGTCEPYELQFLSEEASWDLLREKVFGGDVSPPDLERIGMQIARDCRGLPLVIVVIAGQLMMNDMTRDYWERVAMHLRSAIDYEDKEWCLQILSYCYESLPVHLKPCFLYMGVFPEDHRIEVSLLIKMWVAEGFLKQNGDKSFEDVAMEYLTDLVQRNLILVTKRSYTWKIQFLQVHDFLRDLCLKKAHEYNFLRSPTYLHLGILPTTERMMGFDDHLDGLRARFKDVDTENLQILPIVGMGGIGKTTLVQNVYDSKGAKKNFDVRIWCTISQSPDLQSVLLSFLQDLEIVDDGQTNPKEQLCKRLEDKRYLVVLDDIWGVDVWDTIRNFFPDNGKGSLIIITTRMLSVASYIGTCEPYELPFLNEEASWDLLREKVFGGDVSPPELEHIGMQIAKGCRGLPLVIVVIAGQLMMNDMTTHSWESVAFRLRLEMDSEGEEWCLRILSYCYESLPVHLKPCFLYMGVFPEDHRIEVSPLIKMWVAEGFLKQNGDKSFEDVAMEYLMDLVQRNLIMVTERSHTGNIKFLQVHDFLRELCLRKAHEYNYLRSRTYFNLGILPGAERGYPLYLLPTRERFTVVSPFELTSNWDCSANKNLMHFRLRCIRLSAAQVMDILICSGSLGSISMFQNLHSLIMKSIPEEESIFLPSQIWEMPLLKHIEIQRVVLPNPPDIESRFNDKVHSVLKNMQTLLNVYNCKFSDEVLKMVPNLKKLKMTFTEGYENSSMPMYGNISAARIAFLQSLRSLRLVGSMIPWEDMAKVGSLPNLEKLSLWNDAFCGSEWRTIEGQFCKLKSLHLGCLTLEYWEAEHTHFPVLERLTFYGMQRLNEIPKAIGYIGTLQLLSLERCCTSLARSACYLKQEQDYMWNDVLQVQMDSTVHVGYTCDYCENNPIIGVRYNCKDCMDFDLCEECYTSGLVSDDTGVDNDEEHTSEHEFHILTSS